MKKLLLFALLGVISITQYNAQISTFPYDYGFENETTGSTACDPAYTMLEAGWLNAAGDQMDWTNDVNATGSGSTGPNLDHTPSGSFYMYLEASCSAKRSAFLETPAFDFSATNNPEVSFWYHMYGSTMGTLSFEIDTTGTGAWISIFSATGQQQRASTDPWLQAKVSLSAFVGAKNVKFRFNGTTIATNYYGDMAIDDFLVENILPNDAGVISIDNPMNPITIGVNPVDVTLKNFGGNTLVTADIDWSVDGVPQTTYNWAGSLVQNATTATPVNIGSFNFPAGFSTIKAWSTNPNRVADSANGNDTVEVILCTPLKGNYTLGGATASFNTFNDFAYAANTCGVDSHVVVTVNPGTYTERLILNRIVGTSTNATITVDGVDTALVTLVNGAFSNVYLNGADWVTIKNMTLENTGTRDVYGVQLRDSAMYNTIEACAIKMSLGTGLSDAIGVSASNTETSSTSEGRNAYWTTVSNCFIEGGEKAIHFEGQSASRNIGNAFLNNTIDSPEDYALYIDDQDSIKIIGTTITNVRNVNGDGIYCTDLMMFDISYNSAIGVPDYGLYLSDANFDATPTARGVITNNMISSNSDNGFYLDDIEETDVWHNTVYNTSGTNGAFRVNDMINLDIRNNIFMSETDFAFESLDDITLNRNVVDYNIYWTPASNTNFVDDGPNVYATMALWKTGQPTMNGRSGSTDPIFVSTTDLHATSLLLNDKGDNSVGILDDIDGDTRPMGPNVDMGADEFTPLLFNAAFVSFLEPGTVVCGDSTTPVTVIVRNLGDTIFNMNIDVDVTGDLVQSLSLNYNDTLLFNEYDTVTIGTINTYTGLNYNLNGYVTLTGEQDLSNDTSDLYSFIGIPHQPIGFNGIGCDGDTATITGLILPGVVYEWYDSIAGGKVVGTGNSFQIPSVTTQNTYYLQYAAGIIEDSLSTPFSGGNGSSLNFFDVVGINSIPISGFDGNLDAGAQNVDVYYKVGTWVGSETNSSAWTLVGSSSITSSGNGVPTPLQVNFNGLTIPAGQTYAFCVVASGGLDYTNGGSVGDVLVSNTDLQILEGAGGGLPVFGGSFFTTRNWNGQIHYGYTSCSTYRTEVSATLDTTAAADFTTIPNYSIVNFDATTTTHEDSVSWDFGDGSPVVTGHNQTHTYAVDSTYVVCLSAYSYCGTDVICDTMDVCDSLGGNFTFNVNGFITTFIDASAGNPVTWFWDFGDGNTSNQQNPTHTYATDSSYLVTLVVVNYCGDFSVFNTNIATVGIADFSNSSSITVYPNPSKGAFTLNLSNLKSENIEINIFDQLGRVVFTQDLSDNDQIGNYSIDLTGETKGVYFLRVSSDKGIITRKLVIK